MIGFDYIIIKTKLTTVLCVIVFLCRQINTVFKLNISMHRITFGDQISVQTYLEN